MPKLLLDENIWFNMTKALQQEGFDVVHVNDVNLSGKSDEDVFQYANDNNRLVLTFNCDDFFLLAKQWQASKKEYIGVILSSQIRKEELYKRVKAFLTSSYDVDLKNQIIYLKDYRDKS